MRVVSLNVNGIRAAGRKGFFDCFNAVDADFLCLQETKAQEHQLTDELYHPPGYHVFFHDAERPGYSGVAVYAKRKPKEVIRHLGWECADTEGRFLLCDYDDLSIASLYLPSGSSKDERQALKEDFMERFYPILAEYRKQGKPFIVCGDWNIVHKEIDIKNFKSNQKSSGCLPHERAWLDQVFVELGWVDAFRVTESGAHQYSWWSNRGRAWDNNVGWRIDYQVVTPDLGGRVKNAYIYKEERFSDHAPVVVEYA